MPRRKKNQRKKQKRQAKKQTDGPSDLFVKKYIQAKYGAEEE